MASQGTTLDASSIKVRFADTDTQLKAKDVLQNSLGNNYVVALNLISSSPRWLTSLGALPMYLGLDLRGGVHFLLEVDMKAALDKTMERYTGDIRSALREKKDRLRRHQPPARPDHPGQVPRCRNARQGSQRAAQEHAGSDSE